MVEVEAKYPLSDSLDAWRERLICLGARTGAVVRQVDEYFAHPARDFAATGEAFRIRTVGERNALTYKGPLLDPLTKTRRELEIDFESGTEQAARLHAMLLALGFQSAGRVQKLRTPLELHWRLRPLTLALDEVDGLGAYLEIEIVTDEADWPAAREALLEFASQLGLAQSERRSYLELLSLRGSPAVLR